MYTGVLEASETWVGHNWLRKYHKYCSTKNWVGKTIHFNIGPLKTWWANAYPVHPASTPLPILYLPFAMSNWDLNRCMSREFARYHPPLAPHNDQVFHLALDLPHTNI